MSNDLLWKPTHPENSRLYEFIQGIENKYNKTFHDYQSLHQWSIAEADQFWQAVAQFFKFEFSEEPRQIVNKYKHPLDAQWFEGAKLNYTRHLLRQDNKLALIAIDEQ